MNYDVSSMYSLEAEQMVLGGILLAPAKLDEVTSKVSEGDFFDKDHRFIFRVMCQVSDSDQPAEIGNVADRLCQIDSGRNWWVDLARIEKNTTSSLNVVLYAEKVREYAKLREMYASLSNVQTSLLDGAVPLEDRISNAQSAFIEIDSGKSESGPVIVSKVMKRYYEHVERCYKSGDGITGLRTGFDNVDKRTGGLQPGQFIVLAARPAMGKTCMALNISRYVAMTEERSVLYFSLEMSSEELLGRIVSDIGNLPYNIVKTAQFDEDDWPKFSVAYERVGKSNLYIDDKAGSALSEITSHSKRLMRKVDISLIIIDHMLLIQAEGETDTGKVTNISRSLKRLAKSLNVPVIALCQLNRSCEQRTDKRPQMSDLRQSGAIEEDADLIGFIYRDVVYSENTPYPYLAELIWRKARSAENGTDYFNAQLGYQRFMPCDQPADVVEFQRQAPRGRKVL